MSAQLSRSETGADALESNRVRAALVLAAKADGGLTRLARLREGGGYRIKFPDSEGRFDAVIVNVGGGIAGGDVMTMDIEASEGAAMFVSSQAAEKVYRSSGGDAAVDVSIRVAPGASVAYAPQEAILFNGARLRRQLDVEVAADARALLCDMTVFGRLAMGESVRSGAFRDRWRVRRDGALIHADDFMLGPDMAATLDRPASGDGARAALSIVLVAPDAEALAEPAREALARHSVLSGASAWDGKLVIRALSRDPAPLRAAYSDLVALLGGGATPRYW